MSLSYQPTNNSLLTARWRTVFLSQRDLSGQVPINFVPQTGVSLRAACFGTGEYQDNALAGCLSNLLAVGYRRFVLDLYWDIDSQQWSFCPIATSSGNPNSYTSTDPAATTSTIGTATPPSSTSDAVSNGTISSPVADLSTSGILGRRQELSSALLSEGSATTSSLKPSSTASPSPSQTRTAPSMDLGPVSCTSTVNVDILLQVLRDYIGGTEDTLQANLLYLIFNIHVARENGTPNVPVPEIPSSDLPPESGLIGSIVDSSLGPFVYTPRELLEERSNLNDSWYDTPLQRQPVAEYFTTDISSSGVHSTIDGWPCENFIELSKAKRLLLSWGQVDPQLVGYNFSSDSNIIFPHNALASHKTFSTNESGELTSGCIYDPQSTNVSAANSSWALTSDLRGNFTTPNETNVSLDPLSHLERNLTSCGISPILGITLLNTTASDNPEPYMSVSYSSQWAWAPDEPRNASSARSDSDDESSHFRCALLDPTVGGRWRVEECGSRYLGACRLDRAPYNWSLTPYRVSYSAASGACPDDSSFAVPRTGLENFYLYNLLLSNMKAKSDDDKDGKPGAWVDFNSLDARGCWTTGGSNATCPYTIDAAEVQRRTILVPTIAAIIIAVITALTLFVKCNANRRSSRGAGRRKKRGEGGWDYEGVPS